MQLSTICHTIRFSHNWIYIGGGSRFDLHLMPSLYFCSRTVAKSTPRYNTIDTYSFTIMNKGLHDTQAIQTA